MRGAQTCPDCLRRAWLLGELSERLDRHRYRHDAEGLAALLKRSDAELLSALAGDDPAGLHSRYTTMQPGLLALDPAITPVCRHDRGFPRALRESGYAPALLFATCGGEYLDYLFREPAVAIVGSREASDYGRETARTLGRGLASAGVTVVSGLADGIAASAHAGALEVSGPTLTVMPGGVDLCYPTSRREQYAQLRRAGGVVSELPCDAPVRRWCQLARTRIVVGLADLVIVVEARDNRGDLVHARMARTCGRPLAAVPGRVSSRTSKGPHALLADGALLVRGPQDALDLLYGVGVRQVPVQAIALESSLREVLERVSTGEDTLGKLGARKPIDTDLLMALAELELLGALRRGDGGRYVPSGDFLAG